MKLATEMYIRFKDKNGVQYIRKIVELPEDTRYGAIRIDKDSHNVRWVSKKNVLNASFSVTDLICVGDYVNGMRIIAIDSDDRIYVAEDLGQPYDREFSNGCFEYTLLDKKTFKIKSIVTKEQFENMAYKIEKE